MSNEKLGFIGLGAMGGALAKCLARGGFDMKVLDLNPSAVQAIVDLGATAASGIADVCAGRDVVFTCLPNSPDVRKVVLGAGGVKEHVETGTLVVDLSTIDPSATDEVSAALIEAGIAFVDAPIGRTVDMAEKGEAMFMVGASSNDFGRVKPVLEAMSSTVIHCGAPGTGIRTKLVNNFLSCATAQLSAEAMVLATSFGLDLKGTLEVINGTAATNGHLAKMWHVKTFAGDIEPGFKIDLALKDLGLVMESAKQRNLPLVMGAAATQCLTMASRAAGHGDKDFSGLFDAQLKLVGMDKPSL